MRMNTNIPMMVKTPDFGNSLARGFQTGRAMGAANFARKNGAALMRGDKAALEGYAQIDPKAAFDMQRKQADFEHKQWQRQKEIDAYAASLSAAEREAQAAKLKQAIAVGLATETPEQWDAMAQQFGVPDLIGQFDNREAIAQQFISVADALERADEQAAPADPTKGAPSGYMWADPKNPGAGVQPLPGYESKPADEYGRYVFEETKAGRQPLSRIDYAQAKKGAGTVVYGEDGQPLVTIGGAANQPPKMTVDAGKNTGFLIRTQEAQRVLNELEDQGTRFGQQNLEMLPMGAGNFFRDEDFQKFDQARRDFVNAILRRESGAVISEQEFDNANKQYFPVPGDGPEVIAQKRRNRETAIEGLRVGSGPGAAYVDRAGGDKAQGGGLADVIRDLPDFGAMSDEQLDAWIAENGGG